MNNAKLLKILTLMMKLNIGGTILAFFLPNPFPMLAFFIFAVVFFVLAESVKQQL